MVVALKLLLLLRVEAPFSPLKFLHSAAARFILFLLRRYLNVHLGPLQQAQRGVSGAVGT